MPDRRTYLYRLHVVYPPGSEEWGWEPPGWRDDPGRWGLLDSESGAEGWVPFSWPAVRTYLSSTGAKRRADLLRSYGAIVEIERSQPVEWVGILPAPAPPVSVPSGET